MVALVRGMMKPAVSPDEVAAKKQGKLILHEESTDGGSCVSDAEISSSAGTVANSQAEGGSSSLDTLKWLEAPTAPAKKAAGRKAPKAAKSKPNVGYSKNKPVSSLRDALRAQGQEVMQNMVTVPKPPKGRVAQSKKAANFMPASCSGGQQLLPMQATAGLPVRPPPGLEDLMAEQFMAAPTAEEVWYVDTYASFSGRGECKPPGTFDAQASKHVLDYWPGTLISSAAGEESPEQLELAQHLAEACERFASLAPEVRGYRMNL